MRVAFDSQIFTMQVYGGISRYICSLAKALTLYSDVEPRIFAPLHINAYLPELASELVSGHKVPRVPKTGRLLHSTSMMLAQPAIRRFHPDIVHETYYTRRPINSKDARTVVTVHDMIHEHSPSEFTKNDQTSALKRIATQRADHVICISESTRRDLLNFFDVPEEKISVVYHGFDTWSPGIPDVGYRTKPYLLYVGDRRGYKNFSGFLRAYASSSWLHSNFDVVCFGGGVFSRVESEMFRKLGLSDKKLIQMDGSDNKLASFYCGAALFVYPSLYEGFGIPPLEAMSLDCPVACSNSSSIPEVVGDAAEYFDPRETDSIRTAMESVLSSIARRTDLIERGKLRCTQFSWRHCADEMLGVYRCLM
jgi:glycosyltransferase involved in cell wall biosynthesis